MGHQERKIRDKETLRNAMLAAALSIAEKEGWHALTIRKIADAIEYTAPIVYEHFANKEELISEIIHLGYGTMFQEFENVFELKLEPKETLLEISLRTWDFAFNNKVLYQLMFSLERSKPGDEVIKGMTAIRNVFMKITHKEGCEIIPLVFNWVCLMSGTISAFMMFEGHPNPHQKDMHIAPRELYKSFIERFLNSITL
ncbi:MAG: TetR/AcrR family transcriptional regulator [Bacteroidia bacterium]|nr:TetR/AcrR family transcriptional regulator [Bacteroidia bacterium]